MNHIPSLQNAAANLQKLAAQRQLYASAKSVFGWQFLAAGPLAFATGVTAIIKPELKEFVASWGLIVVLADLFWLTPWQKRMRENAAKIQEQFDCEVLSLPWNSLKAGSEPDQELIKEQADAYESERAKMPPLENWYPSNIGNLPLHLGRIICQRSNCWWDSKQRRHYAAWILCIAVALFLIIFVFALNGGLTVGDFILQVVAPMAPVLLFGLRQYCEQRDAASRLDKLKAHAEALWKKSLSNSSDTDTESRNLQDEIFENRKKGPPVLDFLFKRLRDRYEVQMNYSSAHYVREAEEFLARP